MVRKFLVSFLVFIFISSNPLIAEDKVNQLYFIDAHSQLDHKSGGIKVVIERMSENNVKKTLLAGRSKMSWSDILGFSDEYPKKIIPLLTAKAGPKLMKRPEKYFRWIDEQFDTGKFRGNGEILVFHALKKKQYGKTPAEKVYNFTDQEIMYVMKRSMKENWPVMLHLEFRALEFGRISEEKSSKFNKQIYLKQLKNLLKNYPENSFVLNHLGQLNSEDVAILIKGHKNIYFTTAHSSPYFGKPRNKGADQKTKQKKISPWTMVFNGKSFKSGWKTLFVTYSDRFVFAMDNVWDRHWVSETYSDQIQHWRTALTQVPDKVARAIAHENAERLWSLK